MALYKKIGAAETHSMHRPPPRLFGRVLFHDIRLFVAVERFSFLLIKTSAHSRALKKTKTLLCRASQRWWWGLKYFSYIQNLKLQICDWCGLFQKAWNTHLRVVWLVVFLPPANKHALGLSFFLWFSCASIRPTVCMRVHFHVNCLVYLNLASDFDVVVGCRVLLDVKRA